MQYIAHPYADIFPLMTGAEYNNLKTDIRENGLIEPIVMFDGQVLDGRNRFKACQEVGEEIRTIDFHGDDPVSFVVSLNLHRRHLDDGQRASVAAKLSDLKKGDNQHTPNGGTSQSRAAELLNVSERSVSRAGAIIRDGIEDLNQAVESGEVSISAASIVSALDETDQQEIVDEINQGGKPSEVIKKHVLATKHTGDEESYTPPEYVESARVVMGSIDLDPASNDMAQETVKAGEYYTIEDDGLSKEWGGNVWMNPPYTARVINRFIEKIVDHCNDSDISQAIVLTNNNTDTSWFHNGANTASAVCFTAGRINFLKRDGSKSSPTNGQSFLYFGDNVSRFKTEFSKHGLVMVKA